MMEETPDQEAMLEAVYSALRHVIDPEVGINVVDLGLIYGVTASDRRVEVEMTLTSPACPMGAQLAQESREIIEAELPKGFVVDIKLVWEPAWSPDKMSDSAKQMLGWT